MDSGRQSAIGLDLINGETCLGFLPTVAKRVPFATIKLSSSGKKMGQREPAPKLSTEDA